LTSHPELVLTASADTGSASLVLVPAVGGRARSLVVNGLELLAKDVDHGVGWGWYPMAPWPGRLRDNAVVHAETSYPLPESLESWAIHGTVYEAEWEVESRAQGSDGAGTWDSAVLGVDLAEPWPWPGRVRQTWRLTPESLETVLEVSSNGAEFPAEVGWHPWFRKELASGGPAELNLPATQMYERGADYLPTGRLVPRPPGPYDDAFPLPGGEVGLTWPGALRLTCQTDCACVVVFDQRPAAICVEPQTAPPDGINTGPTLVRPGHPRVARAVWSWSPA
jgi:aldose 1-epimerase